ncbi:MAG: hypothetical protein M0Z51_06865 [Propionibacterium sp.]|nr:hypothetical protein [Propionibacterium sp.]
MSATSPGAAPGGDVREAKAELRARVRRARAARGAARRREADAVRTVLLLRAIEPSTRVACYLSTGDEPGTLDLVDRLSARGNRVLVPLLAGRHDPAWTWYPGRDRLRPGLWGIPEPADPGAGNAEGVGADLSTGGVGADLSAGGVGADLSAGGVGADLSAGSVGVVGSAGDPASGRAAGMAETGAPIRSRGPIEEVPLSEADLVLCSGLAAARDGRRLGVGGGWYDRALRTARPGVPAWILLDDADILDDLPTEPHDRRVDAIVTQSRIIPTRRQEPSARGGLA